MSDPETLSPVLSGAFDRLREALSLNRIASEAEVWLYGSTGMPERDVTVRSALVGESRPGIQLSGA
jgi:hypothetical protein